MEWLKELSPLLAVLVFIWYLRKDSKEDYEKLDKKLESWRIETNGLINSIREDMKQFHEEMRSFHGRVCTLEERRKVEK